MTYQFQLHQARVASERASLAGRLVRLDAFISTGVYRELPTQERWAIMRQRLAMSMYLHALDERINLWTRGDDGAHAALFNAASQLRADPPKETQP